MENKTGVITTSKKQVSKNHFNWTEDQIKLITKTVAQGATQDELNLFLYTCNRVKLDPLTRQIFFVKRQTKNGPQMTIQTGIDGYRAVAERSGTLAGIDDAIYDDPTESAQNPKKASVTVYRMVNGIKQSFTASARWSEYAPQGNQAFMWNKMPYLMLAKCAEALALRKAFPNDLTGIYTSDEMAQADNNQKQEQPQINHTPTPVKIDQTLMEEIKKMIIEIDPTVNSAAKLKEYIEKELKIDLKPSNLKEISDRLIEIIETNIEEDKKEDEKDMADIVDEELEKVESPAAKKMKEGMQKGGER